MARPSRRVALGGTLLLAAASVAALSVSAAFGDTGTTGDSRTPSSSQPAAAKTFSTVFRAVTGLEGLTADAHGNLYSALRATGAPCPVQRVAPDGTATVVGFVPAPCSPSGLAFDRGGRLYVTGAGAAGDQLAVLSPNAAAPPTGTIFATGVPGANGIAFDRQGNLWASDGGTGLGRVFRVGAAGGAATEVFRVPAMTNAAGVGRDARTVPADNPQTIVANGLAFTGDGTLIVADTARGALWQVRLGRNGGVSSPLGCDVTYPADTLCLDDVLVQHPSLEGADGIALDRAGSVWVAANERNAIVQVDRNGRVREFFRSPPAATGLRNAGPLEFPTSPVLAGRRFCVAQSDGARRDNAPNSAGEVGPGTGFAAKISCLDQRLAVQGVPLPVR